MAQRPELDRNQDGGADLPRCAPVRDRGDDGHGLTLAEAARTFAVSSATLRRLISAAELGAWQVRGQRGPEWRVSEAALEAAGFRPRNNDQPQPTSEQAEVRRLTQALTGERARSARLDSELGYALLTIGRLRGRLRDAGIDPDQLFGVDLEVGPEAVR